MADIDNIVDKALDKSRKTAPRKMLEELEHVLVRRLFRTWKMFKYETPSQHMAYDKFNAVMEQLSHHSNAVIDAKKSRVMLKDIATIFANQPDLKYVVEVYWRDKESV